MIGEDFKASRALILTWDVELGWAAANDSVVCCIFPLLFAKMKYIVP